MVALPFLKNQISRLGILVIVTLAPFLAGAGERWSQSFFLVLIALLVGLFPPKRVDLTLAVCGTGLLGLAAASFLPFRWLPMPGWRSEVTGSGIWLPATMSPQPWITLDAFLLLLGGLLWLAWLTQQSWSPHDRRFLAKLFCAGALLLAILALVCFYRGFQIPFWLGTERRFGPFPNRNQTANFFAISAIVSLALAHDEFRRGSKWAAGWAISSTILVWALLLSYSRAGIGIFFLGLLVWVLALSKSYKKMALGLVFVLALLTGFLLFGGDALERFVSTSSVDFRLLIWKDASSMIGSSPWLGIGLGNFDSLFPFFRNASIQQQRIIHPDSDWLWLGAEMGLPAVLLVFCGFFACIRRALPFKRNTARSLRAACAAGSVAFMGHGFLDVSAHRLGTVLPALFVLALALNPAPDLPAGGPGRTGGGPGRTGGNLRPGPRLLPWIFRLLALLVFVCAWINIQKPPGEKQAARRFLQQQNFPAAISHASLALREAPLDGEVFYMRAAGQAASGQWLDALGDFRRANLLEPHYLRLPIAEGDLWLALNPPLAIQSWREVLRRCAPDERGRVFSEILGHSAASPDVLQRMEGLIGGDIDLELSYLPYAAPGQVDGRLSRLLPRADQLSGDRKKILLFAAARRRADQKEFEQAYQLARKAVAPPILPAIKESRDARRDFTLDPGNSAAGFALYLAQFNAGQFPDALLTLDKVNRERNPPKYFRFLAAELNAKLGQWEKAWIELQLFASR